MNHTDTWQSQMCFTSFGGELPFWAFTLSLPLGFQTFQILQGDLNHQFTMQTVIQALKKTVEVL